MKISSFSCHIQIPKSQTLNLASRSSLSNKGATPIVPLRISGAKSIYSAPSLLVFFLHGSQSSYAIANRYRHCRESKLPLHKNYSPTGTNILRAISSCWWSVDVGSNGERGALDQFAAAKECILATAKIEPGVAQQ
ncbi:Hypothetical predicted protein [Olea europaea subsp. europaea]|uniref:Uncharacterized protein n=1 Tax=Olea europaea subsp. europaea TaxID=158383 RepID=A0A8S0VJM9_OLEEU|nr:Hypothetical predicted protein [Olea europaea subsp. europaea]